jgi:hypothetical protein
MFARIFINLPGRWQKNSPRLSALLFPRFHLSSSLRLRALFNYSVSGRRKFPGSSVTRWSPPYLPRRVPMVRLSDIIQNQEYRPGR